MANSTATKIACPAQLGCTYSPQVRLSCFFIVRAVERTRCDETFECKFHLHVNQTCCVTRLARILQLMIPGAHTASCCDSVRSPIHDGISTHSLCPCQLDRVLQHRISTMPVNLLPRPTFSDAGFTIGATDLSAFYSPLVSCRFFSDSVWFSLNLYPGYFYRLFPYLPLFIACVFSSVSTT